MNGQPRRAADPPASASGVRPPTTRISGGLSPRTALGGVLAALVIVGWLGVSGRPSVRDLALLPSASASVPDVAVVPTTTPLPSAPPRRPVFQADVPLAGEQYHYEMMQRDDAYAVLGRWDGRFYLAFMAELRDGRLFGEARMPHTRRPTRATFELLHLWTREPASALEVIETWSVRLPARGEVGTTTRVLQVGGPADSTASGPRLVHDGYQLRISIEWREQQALLRVEVDTAAPRPLGPDRPPLIKPY